MKCHDTLKHQHLLDGLMMELNYLFKRQSILVFGFCLFVCIQFILFQHLRYALGEPAKNKVRQTKLWKVMEEDIKGRSFTLHRKNDLSTTKQCNNFTKPSINPFELDPTSVVQGPKSQRDTLLVNKYEGRPNCAPLHFRYNRKTT